MGYNLQGKIFKSLLPLFLLIVSFSFGYATEVAAKDSIGIEKKDGKVFILHKVEPKETVYGLSKRYGVAIAEIMAQNPEAEQGLKIGQVLRIPYQMKSGRITHTVEASQTLYSISHKYDISIEAIKKWNNLSSNELDVGQELVLLLGGDPQAGATPKKDNSPVGSDNDPGSEEKPMAGKLVHTVEKGQTLFSIATMYQVSVEDLRKWNNLTSNALDIGQQLAIKVESKPYRYGKKNEGEPTGRKEDEMAVANAETNEKQQNQIEPLKERAESNGQEKEIKPEDKEEEAKAIVENRNSSGFKKIVELGMAEVIEQSSNTKKYVALHKTAPVGTIMQVTNEMNNQNVFVRVIGKLPETGVNDKVLIKISRPAFERLGAINDRFPAEISYVP